MRIDPKPAVTPISDAREPRTTKPATTAGPASIVKLSLAGAAVTNDPAPGPSIAARLQSIRAMLDKGDYPVDLDLLASRIVDDEILRSGRS